MDKQFQYPLADRLGFWGFRTARRASLRDGFQYPLADRLGFWGFFSFSIQRRGDDRFSILWRIDLVFGDLYITIC